MYVTSITYGRTMFFTVESERAGTEVDSALKFAYSGAGVDVSGNTSVTYKDIISTSKINAYILGGSGGEAARSIDSYEGLMSFIKSGGNYSKESPGAPIAYKLAYLADNTPARVSLTSDYELKHCDRVSQKVKVTLKQIQVERTSDGDTSGDTLELYGTISIEGENKVVLFDRKREEAIAVKEQMTLPTDGRILGEAIVQVKPQVDSVIKVFSAMYDADPVGGDDVIGDGKTPTTAPFEFGWRRALPAILLSGSGAKVWITIELQPI